MAAQAMASGVSGSGAAVLTSENGHPLEAGDRGAIAWSGFDLVERRWLLRIAQQLLRGPMRFSDLRQRLPGLSAKVLNQRLREMTEAGLVEKRDLAPPSRIRGYSLSEKGYRTADVINSIIRWNDGFRS